MRPYRPVPAVLALLVGLLGPAVSAQVPPEAQRLADCSVDGYDDHCEAWVSVEDDPDGLAPFQFPVEVISSPNGQTVYVALTESTGGSESRARWVILAKSVATGANLWTSRPIGAPTEYSVPSSLVVSPDGARLFVVGSHRPSPWDADGELLLTSFDTATGATLWTSTFNGSPGTDNARSLVVSPDGEEIYIAGISGAQGDLDYTAIAYDAATGHRRWVTRYRGVGGTGSDSPWDMALTPDGGTLLMTGHSDGHGEFNVDIATVAFRTRGERAGTIAWDARYDANDAQAPDRANAIAVSPDGSTVYSGGMSAEDLDGPPFDVDYKWTIVAYDVETGDQRYMVRRSFEGANWAEVTDLTLSPDGATLYATGIANGNQNTDGILAAYDAATGTERWLTREALPEHDSEWTALTTTVLATPTAVVVAANSSTHLSEPLFLNQRRLVDLATQVYDPADGTRVWSARLNATRIGQTFPTGATLAGNRVVVIANDSDNIALDEDIYDGVVAAYDLAGPA
jgi:DNA-binding beta-propeller fold protein YncE